MSENSIEQQPVAEAQAPVGQQPDYATQVELLKAKNLELLGEKRKVKESFEEMQAQIAELKTQQSKSKQAKLAESGEFQTLWKEASETNAKLQQENADLQRQLRDREAAFQQETIKSKAVSAFTQAGVQSPEHMYALLQDKLRINENRLTALNGGVEQGLDQFLDDLKAPSSGYAYMFQGSGARGMGAVGNSRSTGSGVTNPYLAKNFAEVIRLETEDPQLAARLKAEAAAS